MSRFRNGINLVIQLIKLYIFLTYIFMSIYNKMFFLKHILQMQHILIFYQNWMNRSSHPEVTLWKSVIKICSKIIGGHQCRSATSTKLLCTFIKFALRHRCSPVNLSHILTCEHFSFSVIIKWNPFCSINNLRVSFLLVNLSLQTERTDTTDINFPEFYKIFTYAFWCIN